MTETVGVIGLGKVGSGISANLVGAGFDVIGFDLVAEARDRAADVGVRIAADNRAVGAEADAVILSLPHPDASRAAVSAVTEGSDPGARIFDTSTLSPLTAATLAEEAEAAGLRYLDTPITGGEVGARAGRLTVMVGGDPDDVRDHRDVFSAIADAVYHIGDVGDAQFVKLIHNHVGQTTLLILVEGCLLAERWGVDPATLYRTLRYWTGIYDAKLDGFFSNEFPDEYLEHFGIDLAAEDVYRNRFDLSVAHKDLVELADLADGLEGWLPLGRFVEGIHREGVLAGWGDRPHPDLLERYAGLFGTDVESRPETRAKCEGRLL